MEKKGQRTRKYSAEFKLCVILDKLSNKLSRNETVRKYWHTTTKRETLNYTNIVSEWERRYLMYGKEGLMPKQQKPKEPSATPIDGNVEAELKRLRERNYWLEMENEYLKKLDALVRAEEKRNGKKPR